MKERDEKQVTAEKVNKRIGYRVRELRDSKGWTQGKLAEEADLNEDHVSKIERGLGNNFTYTIYKLALALNVKPSEIFSAIDPLYEQIKNKKE